jgi:uncharacterized protein YkwD
MKKTFSAIMLLMMLSSCIKISQQVATPVPPLIRTSTLPPTKSTPPTLTATPTPVTPTLDVTPLPPSAADCKDSAVLLEDVTYPDNSAAPRGEKFTKTWRFKNTGTCNWVGYTIAFNSGDRMDSPDSAPIPQTEAGGTVDISVDLTAPSTDGVYTGVFELRKANGDVLPVGIGTTFWVKITIGNVTAPTVPQVALSPSNNTPVTQPKGPASCSYSSSPSYQNEIAKLVNDARAQNGLPALSVNLQLTAAAQGHSIDMACHGLLSHTGSDASSLYQRITAAGYSPSYYSEIIYGGGYPQSAFDWWMNDTIHRNEILNPSVTEMGVGYAYSADTSTGSYYTVDFASP